MPGPFDRGGHREHGRILVLVQLAVVVEGVITASLLSRFIRPVRLAVAEQIFERLAGVFLVELLAVVGGAGISAVAAERVVLARHAQLLHRAIHRFEQPLGLRLARATVFGMGRQRKRKEQQEKDHALHHSLISMK